MSLENKSNGASSFQSPATDTEKIIKVIGVGGGAGNVVKHMYKEGIHGVSFVLCNRDKQHMENSDIPVKILLNNCFAESCEPKRAEEAARESEAEICSMLNDGTRMAFIMATMGGETGTGAAPVIAGIARKMDILTVGIVTVPFLFEGNDQIIRALDGVDEMSRNVDALFIINSEWIVNTDRNANNTIRQAFKLVNDALMETVKSILELIPGNTNRHVIAIDFKDIQAILQDSAIAQVSVGYGAGKNRLDTAIREALNSPLLSSIDFSGAKRVLMQIQCSSDKRFDLQVAELEEFKTFETAFGKYINLLWGMAYDDSLGEKVKFTILASGFNMTDMNIRLHDKNEER
ncbi:MAG: cell division FtsZ family protein [Tannerella sp.]|jgi:cell division protein FtsZ|nr:cell division FtsZ family protein [Tannerella sp.]